MATGPQLVLTTSVDSTGSQEGPRFVQAEGS